MNKRDFIFMRIVDLINQTEPNSELYLYGSRARETAKKSSDWDFMILLNADQLSFDNETRLEIHVINRLHCFSILTTKALG